MWVAGAELAKPRFRQTGASFLSPGQPRSIGSLHHGGFAVGSPARRRYNALGCTAGQTVAAAARRGRKVRASQGKVVGNAHRPQGPGECHRKDTARVVVSG